MITRSHKVNSDTAKRSEYQIIRAIIILFDDCLVTEHKLKERNESRVIALSPLALLMARRGLSTRSTLRIFTTEIALELKTAKQAIFRRGKSRAPFSPSRRLPFSLIHSLQKEGGERHADDQQVQEVEGVPTEGSGVQKSPVDGHLDGSGRCYSTMGRRNADP